MKNWRIIAVLVLCLVLAGSTACNLFGGDKEEVSWQLVKVVRGNLTVSISGAGNMAVANEENLTFKSSSGRVDKIYVRVGDKVSKGDVLAELASLDTDALELALLNAEGTLIQAQISLQTAEYNLDKAKSPCSSLEISALELAVTQAELAVTQAEAALETAEYNLDKVKNPCSSLEISALELAVTQAQAVRDQAEGALEVAKFNLDRMEDVAEAKDAVSDAEYDVKVAEARLKEAYRRGNDDELSYWRNEIVLAQARVAEAQQELAEILADPDYASLVVDEVIIKKLQVKTAEQSLEQAQKSLEQAQKQLDEATIPDEDEVKLMEMQVEAAKQSLGQVQKSREQAQKQLEEATIPDEDEVKLMEIQVEAAKQSLEQAQKSLEQAQEDFENETITAPWDGVVASVGAEVGDTFYSSAATGTVIVHLIDLTALELPVQVDEIDIPKIKLNQRAIVSIDALPGVKLEGSVTAISPVPAATGGVVLYDVTIALTAPEGSDLKIGMSTTADIIVEKRSNVLLVPSQAITQDRRGNPVVGVMVNNQIQQRSVVTGISAGLVTEIVDGLSEGEIVVIEIQAEVQPSSEPSGKRPGIPHMLGK